MGSSSRISALSMARFSFTLTYACQVVRTQVMTSAGWRILLGSSRDPNGVLWPGRAHRAADLRLAPARSAAGPYMLQTADPSCFRLRTLHVTAAAAHGRPFGRPLLRFVTHDTYLSRAYMDSFWDPPGSTGCLVQVGLLLGSYEAPDWLHGTLWGSCAFLLA